MALDNTVALFIAPCALREAPAGFGLERLATAFMNNPGWPFAAVIFDFFIGIVEALSETYLL